MAGKRKPKLSMIVTARYPKENTEEEFACGVAFILNLLDRDRWPMPPPPPEWEDGRELVEITEELYTDGTRKFINREETVYRKAERKGRAPRRRREE